MSSGILLVFGSGCFAVCGFFVVFIFLFVVVGNFEFGSCRGFCFLVWLFVFVWRFLPFGFASPLGLCLTLLAYMV